MLKVLHDLPVRDEPLDPLPERVGRPDEQAQGGPWKASGFVTSITSLPAKFRIPAVRMTSSAGRAARGQDEHLAMSRGFLIRPRRSFALHVREPRRGGLALRIARREPHVVP
ncbi:MAG: hypothetical protein ACREDF_03520, partial [Thermoplasmata archaeon]